MSTGKAPALYHMRALARTSKVLDVDSSPACPSTPPFRSRSHVSVPFLWEDAPGKPKLPGPLLLFPSAADASPAVLADAGATTARVAGGQEDCHGAHARPVLLKLKLPPRLQAVEHSLSSPKTVLQGPYFGGGGGGGGNKPPRPLRRIMSTASCRRSGGGLFGWRKGTAMATATASSGGEEGGYYQLYAVAPDASCCSPAASSASSSSSSSMSYFVDDHSRRQADGREDSEDGEVGDHGAKGTVRITRFRRNRSLPTMSRSHLWANIRKGIKQISPWSSKPT